MRIYWDEEDAPPDVRERWAREAAEISRAYRETVDFVLGRNDEPSAPVEEKTA